MGDNFVSFSRKYKEGEDQPMILPTNVIAEVNIALDGSVWLKYWDVKLQEYKSFPVAESFNEMQKKLGA